jgi:hypothetical protein
MSSFPERRLLRPPPSLPIRHHHPALARAFPPALPHVPPGPAPLARVISPFLPRPPETAESPGALVIAPRWDAAPRPPSVRSGRDHDAAPSAAPRRSLGEPTEPATDRRSRSEPDARAVVSRPQPPALPAGSGQLLLPGLDLPVVPARRAARIATRPQAPAREALASYPDVAPTDLCRHAKTLGRAGELLVDSLFARLGERLLEAPEHEAYDRILWLPGQALRVQIKTRHRASGGQWVFTLTRGYQRGPGGTRPYAPDDYDILAAVLLSEGVVSFAPRGLHRHCIPLSAMTRLRTRPRDSLDAALRALGHDAAIPQRVQAAA